MVTFPDTTIVCIYIVTWNNDIRSVATNANLCQVAGQAIK